MITIKELNELKESLGIREQTPCTLKENEAYVELLKNGQPLPEGVEQNDPNVEPEYASFHVPQETPLSKEELAEYVSYKQLKTLTTIKNCVVFFTVLTVLSLIGSLIIVLSA